MNNRVIEIDPAANIVWQYGQGPGDTAANADVPARLIADVFVFENELPALGFVIVTLGVLAAATDAATTSAAEATSTAPARACSFGGT